ncbi:hypothetical protein ACQKIK_20960 [Pseudomonas sp. NPDC047961]
MITPKEKLEAFRVDERTSFRKKIMTPNDFGSEVASLSLEVGKFTAESYLESQMQHSDFMGAVAKDTPILPMTFSAVMMGTFTYYVMKLGSSQTALTDFKEGLARRVAEMLPEMELMDMVRYARLINGFSEMVEQDVNGSDGAVLALFEGCINVSYGKNLNSENIVDRVLLVYPDMLVENVFQLCRDSLKLSLIST